MYLFITCIVFVSLVTVFNRHGAPPPAVASGPWSHLMCRLTLSGGCGGGAPEDVSFTRIGGLSWDQWSARLALPLVAGLRQLPPAPGEPSFTCPDCGRVYKLKSSLRNHQKWECGKEPQFQCPYCVYRAKQKMHIARHMERMHREVHMKPDQYIKQDNVDACS